jgi:cell division septum initiation protein DivIVA
LIICVVSIMGLGYSLYATRNSFQQSIATLQSSADSTAQELAELRRSGKEEANAMASNLELLTQRLGVTADDVQKARQQFAQRIKQQQESVDKKLATELATKASSTDVDTLRQEATNKLAAVQEVQKDADAKIGNVSNDVTVVKQDLVSARRDLGRELSDVKTTLSDGIARNANELALLRKKGEREYLDLDVRKSAKTPFQPVGDVQIALTKTDPKRQKYTVVILVDDNHLEKKDRTANEPVQFMVGHDKLRYELVINSVDKDRIQGYLSTPKDKILSAEGPTKQVKR